jgi:hypothetical protein
MGTMSRDVVEFAMSAAGRAGGDWQLRDADGRWVEMYGWVKWLSRGRTMRGQVVDYDETTGRVSVRVDRGRGRSKIENVDRTAITSIESDVVRETTAYADLRAQRQSKAAIRAVRNPRGRAPMRAPRSGQGDVPVLHGHLRDTLQDMADDPTSVESLSSSIGPHIIGMAPDGRLVLTEERQALHDQIVSEILGRFTGSTSRQPEYVFLGGGPAAGKSTSLEAGVFSGVPSIAAGEAVEINADEIKIMLPEGIAALDMFHAQGKTWFGEEDLREWASSVHIESSYLAARVAAAINERGVPAVFDGVGDGGWAGWVQTAAEQADLGYVVKARYTTTPTETAFNRMHARAAETGRSVPDRIVEYGHQGVSDDFPMLLGLTHPRTGEPMLTDIALGANDNDSLPVSVLSSDPATGAIVIEDMAAWKAFLDKGSVRKRARNRAVTNAILQFGGPGGDQRQFRAVMDAIRQFDRNLEAGTNQPTDEATQIVLALQSPDTAASVVL